MIRLTALLLTLTLTATLSRSALACPFCDAPQMTLAEMIDQADHLVLAEWLGGERPTSQSAGTANFRIVDVAESQEDALAVDQEIVLPFWVSGEEGKQYAMMGPGTDYLNWQVPIEVTEESWNYIRNCPKPETDPDRQTERLAYFLDYMEHPELVVSNDAFGEFASAPYTIIRPLQPQLPRENLRGWINDPDTPVTRLALYGLLLGLCGDSDDAEVMKEKILTIDTDFRLGLEGVMSGYVMITGIDGLEVLENTKIRATTYTTTEGEEKQLPFSETYAAVNTLRFLKRYEPDRIPESRLKGSLRLLLDRPELSDLIIADLARWKDWTVQDRLMTMYDDEEFQIPSIKRAIVRYMMACIQAGNKDPDQNPELAASAEKYMAVLEDKDPKTVRDAKRFFIR